MMLNTLFFDTPPVLTPCSKVPDGPLAGNGDIGLALGCPQPGELHLYLGKNDLWNSYSHWETPGMRGFGALAVRCPQAAGGYRAEQSLADAAVTAILSDPEAELSVRSTALRETNLILQEITCRKGKGRVCVDFFLTTRAEEVRSGVEKTGGTIRAFKAYDAPKQEWALRAYSLTKILGRDSLEFTLSEGETALVATAFYTNQDGPGPAARCENLLASLTPDTLTSLEERHRLWWREFWAESGVELPSEPLIERYWYASQYLMACCCGEGKFAPGLFGNWVTTDHPAWGGDYHLNYNYEAPWWGLYSSNHITLTQPYDRPLLDYMPLSQKAAREKLGCRGLYTLVGIGPKGLRTAALTDKEGNDDVNYWGQKSNAAYAAVNMLLRFYATYDGAYARHVAYPYLAETARFWLDYLSWEDGRYVVRDDCIHENQKAALGVFDWCDENTPDDSGQCNPLITLGLLRMLFRGLLDISQYLGLEPAEKPQWTHVLDHLSRFPTMERNGRRVFRYTEEGTDWSGNNSLGIQHIFPAGCVGLGSPPELLETARETFRQMDRWDDYNAFPTYFPAAARLGIPPETILSHLNEQLEAHGYPNGFVFYGGGGIECCSAVPVTVNEMLLQSHEGVLRLFPVWDLRQDAAFRNLRADGAFLVSASLSGGRLGTVEIVSEKGRACRVQPPYPASLQIRQNGHEIPYETRNGVFIFETEPNQTYEMIFERKHDP